MQTFMHWKIHFSDPKVHASVGFDFDYRTFNLSVRL